MVLLLPSLFVVLKSLLWINYLNADKLGNSGFGSQVMDVIHVHMELCSYWLIRKSGAPTKFVS